MGDGSIGEELRDERLSVAPIFEEEEARLEGVEELPPVASTTSFEELRAWADELGITARFDDPAGVLLASTTDVGIQDALRNAPHLTVEQILVVKPPARASAEEGRLYASITDVARAHVEAAGALALADLAEARRIEALGFAPEGESTRAFLAAVEAALARVARPTFHGLALASADLAGDPLRVELVVTLPPDSRGRPRTSAFALLLDDWRTSPLDKRVRAARQVALADSARFTLEQVSRVLRDPEHALHGELVGLLEEKPWHRLLDNLAAASTVGAANAIVGIPPIAWHVSALASGRVNLTPQMNGAAVAPAVVVNGAISSATARDEAVARALDDGSHLRFLEGREQEAKDRVRAWTALSLLVGHERVYGGRGQARVPLEVVSGHLTTSLEVVPGGFTFAFRIDGHALTSAAVRESLDDDGYLVHVDLARGLALISHVGRRTSKVLRLLCVESSIVPELARGPLLDRLLALEPTLPVRLPPELAGASVPPDARPHVRMTRVDGSASVTLEWLVQPLPGGPTFRAGEGPTQLVQQVAGRAVSTMRDAADERAQQAALRGRLPASGTAGEPITQHQGLDAVLDVVGILRAAADAGEVTVAWPTKLPRVVGHARASRLVLQIGEGRDWFGVGGSVDVDGVEVSLADLLAACRSRARFVVVGRDQLVGIEDDLRARLAALEALTRSTKDGLQLSRAAVPALLDLVPSREQLETQPAFQALLDRIDDAGASSPRVPRGFAKVLRSYQVDGFRWMTRLAAWGAGACLADEMGLGKTVQTLALLTARGALGPALVVAPTSVGPNWMAETARFAPSLKAALHRGAGRAAGLETLGANDLLVTSYDLLARDAAALAKVRFATLVLDEAQAVKNATTARAKAARSLQADFRLALTGTPVENRLADLHSLMDLLNPGLLGNERDFRDGFVIPIERDADPDASTALSRLVRPFLLRRRKADVLTELPARTEVTRSIEPSPAEQSLYEAARRHALSAVEGEADGEQGRFRVLAELMRLRRLACHPRLDDEHSRVASTKTEAFLEIVAELREAGRRALVFSQFTGHLALVRAELEKAGVAFLYLDGKTPLAERTKRVAAFQAGAADLFLISLKAGGTGLNLTAADTVIHLDPWWNPAVEDQATDRAHRMGQTRPVTVIRLVAQGTIEEAVMALHADKRQLAESILEGSAASGKLSVAQLGALIRAGSAAR